MKSTAILAHRPVGRPACRAWAEPEITKGMHELRCAEHSAVNEEKRIALLQTEKEERLKKFQHDVKERVRALEKMKKMRQLDKSYEVVSTQQKIMYQSSFPKMLATAKQDTCVYREESHAKLQVGIPNGCKYGYSVVNDPEEVNVASELLNKQVNKVQASTRHARYVLGSHILNIDAEKMTELPGGIWKAGVPGAQDEEFNNGTTRDLDELPDQLVSKTSENDNKDRSLGAPRTTEQISAAIDPLKYRINEFLAPKRLMEQSRKQDQKQLAIYRKLFMKMEREQVRENIRMKEHRKRMLTLKKSQESKRREVEYEIDTLVEQRNQVAKEKSLLQTKLDEERDFEIMKENEKKQQKERELTRYTNALRATLKEKLSKRERHVPALCSCAPTAFDTNPETCANNCAFYRNPKGYARALSSILTSLDWSH